jgi:hypothetical protein
MSQLYKEKKKITLLTLLKNPQKTLRIVLGKGKDAVFQLKASLSRSKNPLKIYPVIYIRTPKCASSSIIMALKSIDRLITIHGRVNKFRESELSSENLQRKVIFLSPGNIEWFQKKHPEIWQKAFKFSVVRNPYDKAISAWRFLDDLKIIPLVDALSNPPQPDNWRSYHHFTRTLTSMLTIDGKLYPDFIVKYENLNNDFTTLMVKLGISSFFLPETNKTLERTKEDKSSEIDEVSKELIGKMFHDDFVTFGYPKE